MNNNKWLLSITAGKWQTNGIKEAKKLGLNIISFDQNKKAEGFKYSDICYQCDINNIEFILKKIHKNKIKISGAICFCSEVGMNSVNIIRNRMNLPCKNNLYDNLINKIEQKKAWNKNFLPITKKWNYFSNINESLIYAKSLKKPFIIKPSDSSGSRGVTKISNNYNIKKSLINAFNYSNNSKIIIEDFLYGKEFAIEIFVINKIVKILSISEKKKIKHTNLTVANEYFTPNLSPLLVSKINKITRKAINALQYNNGPGHLEIVINKNKDLFLLEFAGRGGGFNVYDKYVPLLSGINLPKISILQAIGHKIKIHKIKKTRGIIRYFPAKKGKISSIKGIEQANKLTSVIAESFVKIGDNVKKAKSDGDRLGCLISYHNDYKKMIMNASKATRLIKFDI